NFLLFREKYDTIALPKHRQEADGMNLATLAKLAGVSVATVSKAFAGSEEISRETKERIFALARENGCFDKYNKNRFSKKVIAVICPEVQSEHYSSILTLLEKEITAHGGLMTVSVSNFSGEREAEQFAYFAFYCKADGILIINQQSFLNNTLNTPTVSIFPSTDGRQSKNMDVVLTDMHASIVKAVEYLKECGHRELGFAGERLTMGKLAYYKDALRRAGLAVRTDAIKISEARFEEAGMQIADEWLKEGSLPTAILAAYDYIALGIIKRLRQANRPVPQTCFVIGMDDISVVPYLDTPFSSIRTHMDEACRIAVELIFKKLENPYYRARQKLTVTSEFILRGDATPAALRTSDAQKQ
ncbi:MAG: LacI family DNA-binding transcriptional regulator, partial [Eubacteriales bacterium]